MNLVHRFKSYFWFRIAFTTICLVAVAVKFGTAKPWYNLKISSITPFLFGIALVIPLLALRAWKWKILLQTAAPEASWFHALRSYLGALPISLITPGKTGELIRGIYLPYPQTRGLRAAGLTVIDNWTDFAAVSWWTLPVLAILGGSKALGAGVALCVILCLIPLWLKLLGQLHSMLPQGKVRNWWNQFWPHTDTLGWKPSLTALGIGITAYGIEWAQMGLFLTALGGGNSATFSGLAGHLALIQWANSIQITIAGLGLREGSTAWLLHRSGWDAAIALNAAFLQTTASLLLPAMAGFFIKPIHLSNPNQE